MSTEKAGAKVNEAFELDVADEQSNGSTTVSNGKAEESKVEKPAYTSTQVGQVAEDEDGEDMPQATVYKNLGVICCAFLFLFCAFQALGNLQSTLNADANIGVISQSVIYATLILSSLFLPTFIIRRLGVKWALMICMAAYCPYIAANFYPRMGTMIPAAIILGIGAAPMWSAKCTYLNEIGFRLAKKSNDNVDTVIVKFFGIFFMCFQSSQIIGNLISYLVLGAGETTEIDEDVACGVDFVSGGNNTNLEKPEPTKVNTLMGIYLAMGVTAPILIFIFLNPLKRSFGKEGRSSLSADLLVATFKHMRKPEQIILIPLTIYSGLEQAFFLGDFTRAYVACAKGIHNIGFIAICFGVVNAIVSLSSGILVRLIKRIPVFLIAAAANLGICIGLLIWKPLPSDNLVVFFVVAGLWGLGDAVWQTQINAFYGVLFKGDEEPAFSNYRLWESLGFVMAFAYSSYIDIMPKIVILLCFLGLGIAGYLFIEITVIPRKKKAENVN